MKPILQVIRSRNHFWAWVTILAMFIFSLTPLTWAQKAKAGLNDLVGQPVDIAPSAYTYRADCKAHENPPEGWILLMQYAGLPFSEPVNTNGLAVRKVLCGLLWEEVRPVRRIELCWPADARGQPTPDELVLSYFDGTDSTAHTWWNPRSLKESGKPEISADGRIYTYRIPIDTWGVIAALRGDKAANTLPVPIVRAFVPELWKEADLEIEWGFEDATAALAFDGRIEAYDGIISELRPLSGDTTTSINGPMSWRSAGNVSTRRGVQLKTLYMGSSHWRRIWPYHAQPEDVARTILTVWTKSGNFSFQVSDLEQGPILAPEYGFFVRAAALPQAATNSAGPAHTFLSIHQTLDQKTETFPGVPKVHGWALNGMPWLGVNPDHESGKAGSLTIPARSVLMHPGPDRNIAVGWCSPIQGQVSLNAKVSMGDSQGGNGIDWKIVHETGAALQLLARGVVGTGGSKAISSESEAGKLSNVTVRAGDFLALEIGAKDGNHFCDTTIIDLAITEIGGLARTWSLTNDVIDNLRAGNPHADTFGHQKVWHFYSVQSVPTAQPPLSEPPFSLKSNAMTAKDFSRVLAGKGLKTIRQRVREHPEQSWEEAVAAMHPGEELPPIPKPAFEPRMEIDVPSERLMAQWKLGAWHILRHSLRDAAGKWQFNDYPFGILASETYMILHALDLQGMHQEAADGLDQWLRLPMQPAIVPGADGHHGWALKDRPLGHFSDGQGCLTHAEGLPGVGGHMDGVHAMGPGAIMFALIEHFRLTGDLDWLKAHAARMTANAEWILRQRQWLARNLPNGQRLWSKGLQPAHVVTPDSERMHMQFYESEAYYWLAVKGLADLLALIDPQEGARMAAEAEAYRLDLLAAVQRSIALTPVVPVRDGTYRSFIPFAPYVRGFASGAWGWRRCQGHVGAIYWDTVQSADPLISPSGLLSPLDRRVQGHLDVLEDRLLLENSKVNERTAKFDPEKQWFSYASWQYQCGLERHANIHLASDDIPNFIRSLLNQYSVDIMPGEYTFREHTTGGPPDKIYEESCFLERFRQMLVMEDDGFLWLARAAPLTWFEQGRKIAVNNAPTWFGAVTYDIVSDVDHGKITATVNMPFRTTPKSVFLRLRHPKSMPIQNVEVNGSRWTRFDQNAQYIQLDGLNHTITVIARY